MHVTADGDGRVTAASKRCPWSPLSAAAVSARPGPGPGPVVISLTVLFVTSVAGEIRCFCNQPSCVSTGYMCKSPLGLCFLETSSSSSDGELSASAARTIHACAETLPEAQRIVCATARDDVTSSAAAGNLHKKQDAERSRRRRRRSRQTNLICCGTDMCNYKPRLLINIHVSRSNVTTATKETFVNRSLDVASHWSSSSSSASSSDQQRLWFRICIVAVPLIGAVLLGFIVFAAVRMFRKDRRLHHYSVGRHLPNDRLTTVPLANDTRTTTTARKDRTVFAVPPQYLTSFSPLFPRPPPPPPPPPVRQPQWRTQKVGPTVGNGLSERGTVAKIPTSRHQSVWLSNGLCPVCVGDVYIVVDQRTD